MSFAPHTGRPDAGARIVCEGLVRVYTGVGAPVVALQGLDLVVEPGEMVAVSGASGSGKSTLLNILAALDEPTAGVIRVDDHDLRAMRAPDRTEFRRSVVGFVRQQTAKNLLPYLTTLENVSLPGRLAGLGRAERQSRAFELLDRVGLIDRRSQLPGTLSGGEQQRVAIAVALMNAPRLLLADEPTGELDAETAGEVVQLLRALVDDSGVTAVLVTHDSIVSRAADRTITIRDGQVSSEHVTQHVIGSWGEDEVAEVDYAVLDRAGRLQLPDDEVRRLGLRRRLRVESGDDHLVLRKGEE